MLLFARLPLLPSACVFALLSCARTTTSIDAWLARTLSHQPTHLSVRFHFTTQQTDCTRCIKGGNTFDLNDGQCHDGLICPRTADAKCTRDIADCPVPY